MTDWSLPSPEDSATAPVPHQRANSGRAVESGRVADLAQQRGGGDGADAGFVAQGGAVAVEQVVDEPLEAADLAARGAVLVDERLELRQAIAAGRGRTRGGVEVFEAAQPGFDLSVAGELVADLGGQLGDQVGDVVQAQCACGHQRSAVLKHGLDLGDERVIDLECLDGPEGRLGQQRAGRGDRVDGIGLVQPPRPALGRGARRRDLAGVEPRRRQRYRDVRSPFRGAFHAHHLDVVTVEQVDRLAVARSGAVVGLMGQLDAVGIDDPHGEGVLVGVDPPDRRCHAVLLLEVMFRWSGNARGASSHPSRDVQAPFKTEALLPAHARRDTSGNRHQASSLLSQRRTKDRTATFWQKAPANPTVTLGRL